MKKPNLEELTIRLDLTVCDIRYTPREGSVSTPPFFPVRRQREGIACRPGTATPVDLLSLLTTSKPVMSMQVSAQNHDSLAGYDVFNLAFSCFLKNARSTTLLVIVV